MEERAKRKRLPSPAELAGKILLVSSRASDESVAADRAEEVEEIDEYGFYAKVKNKKKNVRGKSSDNAKERITLLPQWSKLVALEHMPFTSMANATRLNASPWRLFSIGEKQLTSALERFPQVGVFEGGQDKKKGKDMSSRGGG